MEPVVVKNGFIAAIAVVGSTVANWLGGWDTALIVLISLMVIDFITGLLVALNNKSPKTEGGGISSKASFKGLTKKVFILILIGVAAMLDKVFGANYIRDAAAIFYIASEGLSIIENTALMGVPYPSFIKRVLEAMREKGDSGEGK